MQVVDGLEVQISASVNNASKAIDSLTSKLDGLSAKLKVDTSSFVNLSRLNGDNFKKLGDGLNSLSNSMNKLKGINASKFKSLATGLENLGSVDTSKLENLGNINGNSLKQTGEGVAALGNGLKKLKDINTSDFNKLANGIERLGTIPSGNLETIGNSLRPLASGVNTLSNANFDNKNLQNFINTLTRLANADLSRLQSTNFAEIGNSISGLANTVSGSEEVSRNITSFVNAVARLASAGEKAVAVKNTLPQLGTVLKDFISTMSGAGTVQQETIAITDAIGKLANAGSKVKTTADNLDVLATKTKDFIKELSAIPPVNAGTTQLVAAIANLASAGSRAGSVLNNIGGTSKKTSASVKSLELNISKLSQSMNGLNTNMAKPVVALGSLTKQILAANGIMLGVYGAVAGIKKSLDISSSLTEVQNVVDTTFGDMAYKVDDFAKISITQFGMSELSVKQYASRFQAMGTAMGIGSKSIEKANKFLNEQTKGYVGLSDSMSDVSLNLTKLTADIASFYDKDQAEVAEDLAAIYTGMTQPLRTYGLNLTQATVSEWAMKQGLDSDMKSMTAAEQTMLRYQYVLANTKAAHNDFSKTSLSWANQVRILKQNFEQLAATIGGVLINAFKPLLITLNSAMNYINAFAKTVSNALGKIFGWTYEDSGKGVANDWSDIADTADDAADGMNDAADNADKTADATDKATKKQKEFNKQLAKFDELNNYTSNKTDDKDKDDGGKSSGKDKDKDKELTSTGIDGEWKPGESIFKSFQSDIDSLYELGQYIGNTLSEAMESIDWDSVYTKASNFGSGLASFLNGLISPRLFGNVGKTIANSLNTALHFLDSFGTTFNWANFGESLAAGLSEFLDAFDWGLAGKTAGTFGKGIATMLNNSIKPSLFKKIGSSVSSAINTALKFLDKFGTTFNWRNFGSSLGTGLNSFLKGINWKLYLKDAKTYGQGIAKALNSFLAATDFSLIGSSVANFINGAILFALSSGKEINFAQIGQKIAAGLNSFFRTLKVAELAEAINIWVKGALTAVATFLKQTDFEMIGQQIGTFLAGLDLTGYISGLANVLWQALKAAFNLLSGVFEEAPIETALIAAFAVLKFTGAGQTIATALGNSIKVALFNVLNNPAGIAETIRTGLTTAVQTAKDAFIGFRNMFDGNFFSNLTTSINNIHNNLTNLQKGVLIAAGAFTEFTFVSSGVEGLIAGTDNLLAEIGKIAGSVAVAAAAFTAALGFPAGAIATAIVGLVAAIKGINDAFNEISAESAMNSVAEALKEPGGVPLEDLTNSYIDTINGIKSGFDDINEKSKSLETTQSNAENTSKKIDLIKFAVENGSKATEENTTKIKDSFDALLTDSKSIFDQEYDIIMTGIAGSLGQALTDAGYTTKEIVGVMDSLKSDHQKVVEGIQKSNNKLENQYKNGKITLEEYQEKLLENYEKLGKLNGTTDEYAKTINKVSEAVNGVDLSGIVNEDNTINIEAMASQFGELSNTASNAKKSINDSSEGLTKSLEDYRATAEALGESDKASMLSTVIETEKDNIKNSVNSVDEELTKYGNAVQAAILEKIPEVIQKAVEERNGKGMLYKAMHPESDEVQSALQEYQRTVIDPTEQELKSMYSKAGVTWSSYASDASEEVIESLFTPYQDQGVYTILYDTLGGNYSSAIDKAVEKVKPTAKAGGEEIVDTMTSTMPESVNEKDVKKTTQKIADTASKSMDEKGLEKTGEKGAKAVKDGYVKEAKNTKEVENASQKLAQSANKASNKEFASGGKANATTTVDTTVQGLNENWKKVEDWSKNAKMPEVKFTIEDVKSKVSAKWKEVTDWWGDSRKLVINTDFKTTSEDVTAWWKKIKEWWGTKKLEVENNFKTTDSNIKAWWKKLTDWWGTKKLEVNSDFKTTKTEVDKWWTDKIKSWWGKKELEVDSKFITEQGKVKGWWTDKVKAWWGEREVKVGTEYTTKEETVNKWGKNTVKWLKEGIAGAWGGFAEWVVGKIKSVINQVVKGLNWVLKEVGSSKRIDTYAKGSSGLPQDTVGLVNDQSGNTYREMIIPPHGKPFIPKGRNVTLPMKKGTKIMPAKQTKEFISGMNSMPHFAKGIGNFTGDVFDYFDKPEKIIKIATDNFVDFSGLAKASLSISKGIVKTLQDSSVGYIKKIFDSLSSAKVEKAIRWALNIAADNSHGYDQNSRWGNPDYDCSSFVISAFEQAGIKLKSAGATYTGDMRGKALGIGFKDVTSSVNLGNGEGLKRGDILLDVGKHVALYLGNGQLVHASINENGKITGGKPGDQTGREILTRGYYNHPWSNILRYIGKSGDNNFATGIGQISISDIIKGYAKGGLSKDEVGIVNDQKGNVYKELIIPPNGEPFIPEGRNVTLPMEKGTRIIPAEKTKKILKNLPHFANGTEDFSDDKKSKGGNSIVDNISQAINDTVVPYIREMIRILEGNVKSGGTTVTASNKKTTTKYSDTVKEIQKAWNDLAKWFETTVVQPIEATFATMKEQIVGIFSAINEEVSANYEEYSKEWQETLQEIPTWISEGISDSVLEKFQTLFSNIQEELTNAWSTTQDTLSEAPEWIETNVTSSILEKFTTLFEQIVSGFTDMWSSVSLSAEQELTKITVAADGVIEKIDQIIIKAKDAISTLEKVVDAQKAADAAAIQAQVKQATTDISSAVQDITSQLGSSVINAAVASVGGSNNTSNQIAKQADKKEEQKKETYEIAKLDTVNSKTQQDKESTAKLKSINTAATTVEKLGTLTTNTFEAVSESMEKTLSRLQGLNLSSKIKVKRYATGGFPEDGWFRASHGEMIGQFDNGQSVVANNQQITNGIAIAVQEANKESNMLMKQELSLLQRQNELLMGILEKETGISKGDIFNAVKESDAAFRKRTGKSAFAY